jgi:hypothetical protein
MGVLSISRPTPISFGGNPDITISNRRFRTRDVTFSNSYATGGDLFVTAQATLTQAANAVGLRQEIQQVIVDHAKNAAGTSLVVVRFDYAAGKLQAYRYDGASAGKAFLEEVTAAVDLSLFTARLTFIGV